MKIGTRLVTATVNPLKHKVNVNTLEHLAAERLELNDIGVCELELDQPIVFDPYEHSRDLGGFILIDRLTNNTVAAGMLHFALRRSQNVQWQFLDVNKPARATLTGQRPCVVWFTGLSGAGKSTIANLVERKLHACGRLTYLLDGDNVRHGLNKDLGFTEQDRVDAGLDGPSVLGRQAAKVCRSSTSIVQPSWWNDASRRWHFLIRQQTRQEKVGYSRCLPRSIRRLDFLTYPQSLLQRHGTEKKSCKGAAHMDLELVCVDHRTDARQQVAVPPAVNRHAAGMLPLALTLLRLSHGRGQNAATLQHSP
jgi:hypothetical protein